MKKILSLITSLSLCVALTLTVSAAGLNANEQKILNELKAGVNVDGKMVNLGAGYINQAETYLTSGDVDITDAQAETVISQVQAAKAIVVENKITNLNTMPKKFQDQIIGNIQTAAAVLGLTVSVNYADKEIVIKDKTGKIIASASKAVKNTGDNFTSTLALSGAIALLLAGAGIVAARKGLFVKG
ncbi:MAG: LPXTG cell wall anchor domain-containing protein [Longicatena sp.]